MMKQALQRCRGAIERHSELLAHDGNRHIDGLYATQHIGHEVTEIEAPRVLSMREFVVGRPVDVVENGARQPTPCEFPKIVEVVTIA